MALLIKKAISSYLYAERELIDPRTQDWFLVGNTWQIVLIIALYNYFVLDLGPKLMKNRKPFDLTRVLIVYNVIQIALCLYLVKEAIFGAYLNGFSLTCEPVDYGTSDFALRVARGVWLYFIVKVIDLLDTVFFVLRKKQSQITFLHVYHHSGMAFTTHFGVKYLAGGNSIFLGSINSFVHIVMYSYYLMTAWKPELKTSLWWKKHITQLQIFQFGIISIHQILPLILPNCKYPAFVTFLILPQNFFMMVLFTDFYRKTYLKKDKLKQDTSQKNVNSANLNGTAVGDEKLTISSSNNATQLKNGSISTKRSDKNAKTA